ncbi:hypothetical protein ACFYV7_04245 [Nocardia suismassiliense]|uniref:Transmembrane protein n=1 Tax=Nocardia suismassiliense TaxID=2077092 RepID=A0ABW6QL95_9NOCA
MHTLITNLNSLWKVGLAGLILGAGLPMVFAIGVRFWSMAETVTPDGRVTQRNYPALTVALLCFGLIIAAIITGILYTAKAFIAARFGIHLFGQS